MIYFTNHALFTIVNDFIRQVDSVLWGHRRQQGSLNKVSLGIKFLPFTQSIPHYLDVKYMGKELYRYTNWLVYILTKTSCLP